MAFYRKVFKKSKEKKTDVAEKTRVAKGVPSAPDMEIDGNFVLKKYTGQDEVVTVPEGVVKIGLWAFQSNASIREVLLPESLTEIDVGAFERSSLEKIVIPDGVRKMGYTVFRYCKKLCAVTLPDHLECIDNSSFDGCEALKELKLPRNLKKVNKDAFQYCGMEELDIPNGMKYIGDDAFRYMRDLKKLSLPPTLKGIGAGAFSFCGSLEELYVPEGVLEIGDAAFDACTRLEKLELPETLIHLGRGAFSRTKASDSREVKAAYDRLAQMKVYPKPAGYQELDFHGKKFYYQSESEICDSSSCDAILSDFTYAYDIMDSQAVYKTEDGKKVLRIYVSVPTFDSGDREWDSYRKLYLIPQKSDMTGILVFGGYRIAKIISYSGMECADERTEKWMKSLL